MSEYTAEQISKYETVIIFKSGRKEVIQGMVIGKMSKTGGNITNLEYHTTGPQQVFYLGVDNIAMIYHREIQAKTPPAPRPQTPFDRQIAAAGIKMLDVK